MHILFDQGTPVPLRGELVGHVVETTFERGWSRLGNGELLREAEAAAFDLLVTTDQNLCSQQNLASRRLAVMALPTTRWPTIQLHAAEIRAGIESIQPGEFRQLMW